MFESDVAEALPGPVDAPWPLEPLHEPSDEPDPADFPPTVANTRPSGWLGLELDLSTAEPSGLNDAELVDATVGFERMIAWAQARQARVLAEFARRRPAETAAAAQAEHPSPIEPYAADEIGLALHLSRGTASIRIHQSVRLAEELPATLQLWERGEIDSAKVRAICESVLYLSAAHSRAVEARVLPKAPGQTVGQLRAALARAVIAVDPAGAAERHRGARADRRVALNREHDGMASLWALLPAPEAGAAFEWLSRLARSLGPDDTRTMDARRADLLVALLTGRLTITPGPGAEAGAAHISRPPATPGKALVHVVMPYSTLIGADEQPCELAGYGSIPAELARTIAADSVWKRLVTDPISGALLDHGRTTYRPPPALADHVRARDLHCRSPICGRRAINCELDHAVAWEHGGPTAATNLWCACSHDHHLKHDARWSVVQHADGRITWHTPTGHSYTSEPHDYRPAA